MKRYVFLVMLVLNLTSCMVLKTKQSSFVNEKSALRIAELELQKVYGNSICNKAPFRAELIGDSIWHIQGSLPPISTYVNNFGDTVLSVTIGGVPHVFLNKSDGRILNIYHTK
jgi:hypothetical protein